MKKIFSFLAAILVAGSTFAADPVASQAPVDGESYVVAAYVNSKYYALPCTTSSGSTITGVEISLNAIGKVNTTDAADKTWTLIEGETTGQFLITYKKNTDTYYLYKNGTGKTNYNFKINTSASNYWTFTANGTGYTVTAVDRGSNNTLIQCNGGTFRCYSSATAIILLPIGDVPSNPMISVSPKSLDFGTVEKDAAVAAKTFDLAGYNLTDANKVTVTAPAGYKVSIGDTDPATSLELTPSSKSIASTTIKVTPVTSEAGTFNSNITISSDDLDADSTVALTMTVVAPVAVESVSLDKETLSLADGDTYTLTATIAPDEATNKNVTWESSDEDIATVDENGLVTAKETGKATITCKSVADNTKTATCVVTVSGADVVLDFTSNDGWNFPTDSKETTEDTFTKGDYSVTLGGGYQYYEGEILVGKTNAYMKLPVFANNAIAKIVTVGTETGSASVTFNVFDGTTAVSTEVTSCKVDQTFIISPKKKNVEYTIKITNNNNARFPKIKIYFGEPTPPTAVDNTEATVKAVKFIENGQLFIEKNGHVYNVQGQIVR